MMMMTVGQRRRGRPKNTRGRGNHGAGDRGTSHVEHNGDNSSRQRAMEATRWWLMLTTETTKA